MKNILRSFIFVLGGLVLFTGCAKKSDSLFIHCAAGMRDPVSEAVRLYEQQEAEAGRPVKVEMTFDGSNRLLGQISLSESGDLYIAGDADYIRMAAEKGLAGDEGRLCYFVPVIIVAEGNPKGIETLSDLTEPGIRLGAGDPKAAAVGRLTLKLLKKNGIDVEGWNRNLSLSTPTVNELALSVKLGTLDAALVWDSIALNYPDDCDALPIPPEMNIIPEVGICTLKFSKQPEAALKLMNFLTGPEGQKVMKRRGYTVSLEN